MKLNYDTVKPETLQKLIEDGHISEYHPVDAKDFWESFFSEYDFESEVEIYWSDNPRYCEDLRYEPHLIGGGVVEYKFKTLEPIDTKSIDDGSIHSCIVFEHFYDKSEYEQKVLNIQISPDVESFECNEKEIMFNNEPITIYITTIKVEWNPELRS